MQAMIDSHIHIGRCLGKTPSVSSAEHIRASFAAYASSGVIALRDGGDRNMLGLKAREIAGDYGLSYKTPVYALYKTGGYGSFLGRAVSGVDEIKNELSQLMNYAPDFIKVIQSGIVSFNTYGKVTDGGFSPVELRCITDFARSNGLKVMAHCNSPDNISTAITAGVSSIEHGYFIEKKQLSMMAHAGIIWVPTFIPLWNFLKSGHANRLQQEVLCKTLDRHRESLHFAVSAGVSIALGSDAGAGFVPHGTGIVNELSYFTDQCGIDKSLALTMMLENGKALIYNQ